MEADPDAIRRAREEAALTQEQLGHPLLTRQAVSAIEMGRVKPSARSLGHIATRLGLPVEALLREGGPAPEVRVIQLRRLCEAHDYRQALHRAEVLLKLRKDVPALLAGAHHYAGIALYYLKRYEEAAEHQRAARSDAERIPDPWLAAESLDWEAASRMLLGDPHALVMARDALTRYRRLQTRTPEVEVRMLRRLATILHSRGQYAEAERNYNEALEVSGVVQAMENAGPLFHGLAGISKEAGDLPRAIELMRRAIACYRFNDALTDIALARAENDLAQLLIEVGTLDEADTLLASTLTRLSRIGAGAVPLRPDVVLSTSRLREKQGRPREAVDLAQQAVELSERAGFPWPLAESLMHLGDLQEADGHPRLADRSYRRAIDVLRGADLPEREREAVQAYRQFRHGRRAARRAVSS